ncbi:hypothetical protein NYZ99_08145 [Maribacter litopenaei]|uniref:Uncharacterized protein n=1 Tax=Maribacter litopenaei TaxID=2976127 RepID=A0ABY5YD06_9FLAO|nr:hypothetical protein [Maribacter litopenaei]UWX56207.1 hypothetical protein NYZ99_08145 [Maribacter litopenaei]
MQRLKLILGAFLLVLILFTFSAATIDIQPEEVSKVEFQNQLAIQKEAKIYASEKRHWSELLVNTLTMR